MKGRTLAHYEILDKLGEGGMGAVWQARDTRLNRIVAIKTLPADKVADAQRKRRFVQEAQSASALNHPNIVTIYDINSDNGADFIVMELVRGKTLDQLISRRSLRLTELLSYAIQTADALSKAHAAGIVHRDLKPGNIMVTEEGRVKVLDFGLAKLTEPAPPGQDEETCTIQPETEQGTIVGTIAYMSPEQAESKPVDARSDIFSLGAVLYEMATGSRAFQGSSKLSTLSEILRSNPKPPSEVTPGVPRDLDKIIARCLRKDPARRYQTMTDLKLALEDLKEDSCGIAQPPLQHGAGTPGAASMRHRLPWTVAGICALIALWALWRFARPVETTQQPSVRLDLDLGPDVSLGSTTGPAVILSPDGTRLVFVSQGADGTRRLFTRRLDQPKTARLLGTEGAYAPFFSPDGQWVGFFAQGKLKKTRIDGGEPVSLCDAPQGRGASWGEDGAIIAALDTLVGLSQVPPEGGKPVSVTNLSLGEVTHRWPQVLPGAKAVLFNASRTPGNHDDGIAVVSLKDRRTKTLIENAGMFPRYLQSGHLVYVTKGTLVAVPFDPERLEVRGTATPLEEISSNTNLGSAQFDCSRSGTLAYRTGGQEGLSTIQWLDGPGKPEVIEAEPASYNHLRLSPDGLRLAYAANLGSNSDVWIYDLQRGGKTRLTSGSYAGYPVWSPDGRFVVFQSVGGMFWTRADGAGKPQPLIQSRNMQLPCSFTPNGTRLVFSELTPDGGAEIRTVPVDSRSGQMRAGEQQFFLKTPTVQNFAAFSPDGRWLAYADAEAGSYEVYVRAFPDNGAQVQISNAGGVIPVWSRNGHELFYRTVDNRIMVANYTVKGESFVADKPRVWSGKQLANLGLSINFDLAPDGKRFVVLMPAESPKPRETQSHVTLVVNLFDEVRRRVAAQGK
jgi:serine/threonine-protein kinase